MTHLKFYFEHALRGMARNGRRTAFALFCIAAGVAAIVALRSLSLIIADSLTANIAQANHGDLHIEPSFRFNADQADANTPDGRRTLASSQVSGIEAWAKANNLNITPVTSNANIQVASLGNSQNAGRPQIISSYVIDPAVYPFYSDVVAVDPAGVPLSKLFTGGNDVVISKNLADNNQIKVGDQVHVGRTSDLFTVRGIVPTETESSLRNPLSAFFGFAYFDQAQRKELQLDEPPNDIYVQAPAGTDVETLRNSLDAQVPNLSITTTNDIRRQNQNTADLIDRLITIMGLAALLIGAMGIIHTMLVVVGRRTVEIAVFKTLGVQGRQITIMFFIEALLMGVIGSLLGVVLGVIFSFGVRAITQNVWPQTLGFRLYPQAWVTGAVLGIVITAVFGFLPTLMAGQIRPAVVLRPNEARIPAAGCLQTILSIGIVVLVVGLIAGQVVGTWYLGLIGVALTAVIMAVIIGLLWLLIVVISALPSFGSVDLRLALRGIGTHRTRTASTLLALIAGVFSLSMITLMAESVPRLLDVQLTKVLGGNVLVFALVPVLQRPFIIAQLKGKPGVQSYSEVADYSGHMTALNGDTAYLDKLKVSNPQAPTPTTGSRQINVTNIVPTALGQLGTADVTAQGYSPPQVVQGRPLGPQDSGKLNATLQSSPWSDALGIKPGDTVTIQLGSRSLTLTVVGLTQLKPSDKLNLNLASALSGTGFTIPVDALPAGVTPTFQFTIANVDQAHLNQTLINLTAIPGVFSFDVSFFDQAIQRFVSQFTVIPSIVAVLALFAGAVIIANTVSLSTLERRRQVGVMKALGLSRRRVLLQMVIENGLIGLLGGLIGVGIGALGIVVLSIGSQIDFAQVVPWGTVGILLALSLVISLVATLLSAWTAATEKPLNVLRYE